MRYKNKSKAISSQAQPPAIACSSPGLCQQGLYHRLKGNLLWHLEHLLSPCFTDLGAWIVVCFPFSHSFSQLLDGCFYCLLNITEVLQSLLMGSALACSGLTLEPAGIVPVCVGEGSSFLSQKPPLVPSPSGTKNLATWTQNTMPLIHLLHMMTLVRTKFTFVSQSASWLCRIYSKPMKLNK